MKYGELIQFSAIQSVKVLRDADRLEQAREDVSSFVISERMADLLRDVILRNLDWETPHDNRGLLAVGNYGSGKTHLMSFLSAIAEHAELVSLVRDAELRPDLGHIAGRFCVIRAEIGAVEMSLRDIVCKELERGLARLGVRFAFPTADQVTNNKDSLRDMMAAFEQAHGDKGLFFVLDELLDFLRTRRDAELVRDLALLREVGEICGGTRFRFLAGIQEAIFDNPRFAGVADAVRRVRDRFEQVRISREDIAFVVAHRLLRKDGEQRQHIREHLRAYTPLFDGMAENLEEFVELFPVHPAYLRTFERISAVEKRDVLKTLSLEMQDVLNVELPAQQPGLICYDSYRARLAEDPANRQVPEVREVLDKTDVLRSRIERAMVKRQYVPLALRIVDGLAVHRLTTEDVYAPIGATRMELKDDLCLLPDGLPERDPLFVEAAVDTVLAEIVTTVSGQFLTENPANGQVYLDLHKDIDYDQKIDERAATLDADRLNEAYFTALEQVLERRGPAYVAGYKIWEYELPWPQCGVSRIGYLFMGAPNERSTAQPPRDFYVYFLQPFDPPKFKDDGLAEEVLFRLERPAPEFTTVLKRYAGAMALAGESTAAHRSVYESKAATALQNMVKWLLAHMAEAMTVTYIRRARPLREALAPGGAKARSLRERLDAGAASMLASHFAARYPDYPRFGVEVTHDNLDATIRAGLSQIVTGRGTHLGQQVLQALELLTEERLVDTGRFAQRLLTQLQEAGGRTLNRSEVLVQRDRGVWTWPPWHLEPAWLLVVAAALTQLGRLEIGFPTGQVDALGLDRLAGMPLADLEAFSHFAPPKALPVVTLREIARLLGLPPGIVGANGVTDAAVIQFVRRAAELSERVVKVHGRLLDGIELWGAGIVEQKEERDARLAGLQSLLQDVRARNTPGKLNRIQMEKGIGGAEQGLRELERLEAVIAACDRLAGVTGYLRQAAEVFGPDHSIAGEVEGLRRSVLDALRGDPPPKGDEVARLHASCEDLRRRFAELAVEAHKRDRLDASGDDLKRRLLEGPLLKDLSRLATVSVLPAGAFGELQAQLTSIGTCKEFDEAALRTNVICPACGYRPQSATGPSARALLDDLSGRLEQLRATWERALLDELGSPDIQAQIPLLDRSARSSVEAFLSQRHLPSPVSDTFAQALNQLFLRFEVREVGPMELWTAVFPGHAPTTREDLQRRFQGFLADKASGAADERLRFVPRKEDRP